MYVYELQLVAECNVRVGYLLDTLVLVKIALKCI